MRLARSAEAKNYQRPVSNFGAYNQRRRIMTNSKLQAALDEIERLCETVKEYKKRNGQLPHADSDAGRAVYSLQTFQDALKKFDLNKILDN